MDMRTLDSAHGFPVARNPKIPPRLAEAVLSKRIRLLVANQKGGVGKSVISFHSIAASVQAGIPTLAADFDSQGGGNLTVTLLNSVGIDESQINLAEYLCVGDLFADELPNKPLLMLTENLFLIPAGVELEDVDELPMAVVFNPKKHLKELTKDIPVVVLDTPPSTGKALVSALMASSHVLLPFEPAKFSIKGAESLLTKIKGLRRRYNPELKVLGFIASMFKTRSKYQRQVMEAMANQGFDLVTPAIPEMVAIQEAVDGNYFTGTPPKPVWNINSRAGNDMGESIKNIFKECSDYV